VTLSNHNALSLAKDNFIQAECPLDSAYNDLDQALLVGGLVSIFLCITKSNASTSRVPIPLKDTEKAFPSDVIALFESQWLSEQGV
jgi:hypothetical protein